MLMLIFIIYAVAAPSPAKPNSFETSYKISASLSIPTSIDYSAKDHFPIGGAVVFILIALVLIWNYLPASQGRRFNTFKERNHCFCNASINAP